MSEHTNPYDGSDSFLGMFSVSIDRCLPLNYSIFPRFRAYEGMTETELLDRVREELQHPNAIMRLPSAADVPFVCMHGVRFEPDIEDTP